MDSTQNTQPEIGTKRNITKFVLNVLCITIFPLIYVLGKTLVYFMHLIMDV